MKRHDTTCTISPPTAGPSSGSANAGITTKFIADSSSALLKVRTMVSRPTGIIIITAPRPCSNRAATAAITVGSSLYFWRLQPDDGAAVSRGEGKLVESS